MKRETRDRVGGELRVSVEDGEHFVTLQAIKTGVVDDYGSVWEAATFDKYAEQRLPVLCWAHDWSDPLGHAVDYQSSSDGPRIKFRFDDFEDVRAARRAFSQVNSGTIQDCSVGFSNTKRRDPTEEEVAQYPGIKEVIFEAELDEVSLVLRGAVPGAKVLAFRSADKGERTVPVDFVIDLARKISGGDITHAEAEAALDLVATEGKKPDPDPDPEPDAAVQEAEAEADAVLRDLDEP